MVRSPSGFWPYRRQLRPALRRGGRPQVKEDVSALVLGGGLAGLAAATVLAERGVRVTVVEREAYLGGRLGAWPDQLVDGTPFQMERGFHAFFRQYYNLRRLLQRVDPSLSFLTPLRDYPLLGPNGATESFEDLPTVPLLNLWRLVQRSDHLSFRELRHVAAKPALAMLAYDPDDTYDKYDGMTAQRYLDGLRFPPQARRMLFDVFSHSFFNAEARYSAAELLMNFHFYFVGNPEGLVFDVMNEPFEKAFLGPLEERLLAQGVTVRLGTEVRALRHDNGRFVAELADAPLTADCAVLALNVPGLKAVAANSATAISASLQEKIDALSVADPFYVLRVWFDRPVGPNRPPFAGTTGLGLLDNISVFERVEQESERWSRARGGSVVELHAYAVPQGRSASAVREELLGTLRTLYPELRDATILDERAFMKRDCPAFEPGSHKARPTGTEAGPRLALAGDYLKTPIPCALMERAVTTGILAANHVLADWDIEEEPVYSVPLRGLLARPKLTERSFFGRALPGSDDSRGNGALSR